MDKGAVTGSGILYSPGGNIVYQGNFDRNLYQGAGTCYYDNGVVAYSGSFEQILRESDCYFIGIRNEKKHASIPFYDDIRAIPFSDIQYPYDTIWVCRKNWKLSAAAKRFLREFYQLVCGETPPKDLD